MTIKVDIPKEGLDLVATCIVQDGWVISIDTEFSSIGESKVNYMVHLDHRAEEDCSDRYTNQINLEQFLLTTHLMTSWG